jgi:cytochrome P450
LVGKEKEYQNLVDRVWARLNTAVDSVQYDLDQGEEPATIIGRMIAASKGPDSKQSITEREMRVNAFVAFVGGYDTTSSAIQFASYHLA